MPVEDVAGAVKGLAGAAGLDLGNDELAAIPAAIPANAASPVPVRQSASQATAQEPAMFHIAVAFNVPAEYRQSFIEAALEDGRNSARDEPGTKRFELIQHHDNPNRFYLNEAYDDKAAFDAHCAGEHFAKFFSVIEGFAQSPEWLIRGARIEDPLASSAFTMVASFVAKPGSEQALRDALVAMIEPSLAEAGCLSYLPVIDAVDPARLLIIESWASPQALEFHFSTPHFKQVAAQLENLLAEPFRISYYAAQATP